MDIVFAGTPDVAVPNLQALVDSGHTVTGVITREDARVGRKGVLTPSPVAEHAGRLGLTTLKANRLTESVLEELPSEAPDLGVVVAYGGLIREPLLSYPKHGWINVHFSDLPRWRGAAPVQRALMAGEHRLGITVFRLVEALDAGPVVERDAHDFPRGTTAGDALASLATLGTKTLLRAIDNIAQDPASGDEQGGEPSYAHKLSRSDGKLDLRAEAGSVLDQWSGVTPQPGAFALLDEQPVKILELREPTDAEVDGTSQGGPASGSVPAPGTVHLIGKIAMIWTGEAPHMSPLVLERVQPAGRGAMEGAAWLRGRGGKVVLT